MNLDQLPYSSEYNSGAPSNYWNNELSASHASDSYSDESASYLTVIKPKINTNPYLSTLYNKDLRGSIYRLAANVNSLEANDKRNAWVQSLLQKEITHQPEPTTPQVILAYSPNIIDSNSLKANNKIMDSVTMTPTTTQTNRQFTSTTAAPITPTTDPIFSHYNQPALPVRGPLYLIIQGHSKVKTYGIESKQSKNENKQSKNEPKLIPVGGDTDPVIRHVASDDTNSNIIQIKHLHKTRAPETKTRTTQNPNKNLLNSSMSSLLSLLDSPFGFTLGGETKQKIPSEIKKTDKSMNKSTTSTIIGPTTVRTTILSTSNKDVNS